MCACVELETKLEGFGAAVIETFCDCDLAAIANTHTCTQVRTHLRLQPRTTSLEQQHRIFWPPNKRTHACTPTHIHTRCGCGLAASVASYADARLSATSQSCTRAYPHICTRAAVVAWRPARPCTQTPGCQPNHNHTHVHLHISTQTAVVAWQPTRPCTQTLGCQPHHNHAHMSTHTYPHRLQLWPGNQHGLVRRRPVVSHITIMHKRIPTHIHTRCGCGLAASVASYADARLSATSQSRTHEHPYISTQTAVVAWQPAWPRTQTLSCQPHHNHAQAHTHTHPHTCGCDLAASAASYADAWLPTMP